MGSTKLSEDELALRIDGEKVRGADGITRRVTRYEMAYKPEVKAFVDQRIKALSGAVEEQIDEEISAERKVRRAEIDIVLAELNKLHLRTKELELTRWRRFKRWAADFLEDIIYAVSHDPSQFPMDDSAVILPHGTQAELDASDTAAFAMERGINPRHIPPGMAYGAPAGFEPLRRALQEMPTECAEDLAENPVIQEAIDHIKKFEGVNFDPNRYRGLMPPPPIDFELPELQGLPEYTAEEMPSVPEQRRTHDGELEMKPQHDLDNRQGYLKPGKFTVGKRIEIPPSEMFPSLGDPNE